MIPQEEEGLFRKSIAVYFYTTDPHYAFLLLTSD
jgi:hypothetical protein